MNLHGSTRMRGLRACTLPPVLRLSGISRPLDHASTRLENSISLFGHRGPAHEYMHEASAFPPGDLRTNLTPQPNDPCADLPSVAARRICPQQGARYHLLLMHYPHKTSKIKRIRNVGFRARMKTRKGRKIVNRQRRMGRTVGAR